VRLGEASSRDIDTISALLLRTPKGSQVLAQVAEISLVEGPAQISREDTRQRITV
jgi:cobalt-zinc-cadmium resistance protein CzcA